MTILNQQTGAVIGEHETVTGTILQIHRDKFTQNQHDQVILEAAPPGEGFNAFPQVDVGLNKIEQKMIGKGGNVLVVPYANGHHFQEAEILFQYQDGTTATLIPT